MDLSCSQQAPVVGPCEQGSVPSGSIKVFFFNSRGPVKISCILLQGVACQVLLTCAAYA
jgi:hypothetical protein